MNVNYKKVDRLSLFIYIFLLMIGLFSIYYAYSFPKVSISYDIGADVFPIIFSSALSLLCICGIFKTIFVGVKYDVSNHNIKKSIFVMFLNALSIAFMNFLGFYLSCFIFLCFLMFLLGIKNKAYIFIFSTIIMVVIYIIFQILLSVPLPMGEIFSGIY
ncbi:tripartite tricarboxylate transporter TctB family protein [Gallibacterium sp. AGMB14963]|uniref:tripartite tricarboxylate transporter TctB family protein n=1 Tax=Gallibacterium faecale TaxID=3019086 RepID=UPI0022F178FB|nr:tripartite tricarboxylate transporter TctB family protein [Gallibacterium sp. AGMB14963]MDA3979394.1 tripartite tricarboxylate transporter TctB family protein [Gallibacterium sp. AGMB14963]